ncbi:MAG: Bro-N domain-containing protein [Oscillibacter sp.]|nr:Bro-N domain-containing protein [Oscillibacter sp.]
MSEQDKIQLFENQKIRTAWDAEAEEWYFSVADVVQVLTDSSDPKQYIKKMRSRDPELGSKWGTICTPVEMIAADGKKRKIQAAAVEGLLRIIQSIPSPKAEPFKLWLAQVGRERIEETIDPEQAIDRAMQTYLRKGYSEEWIHQRLLSIRIRNDLTAEWQARGVERGREFAILIDEITRAWSGMSTRQYKNLKGLKKENLRDNMTDLELVLTMLSEATATEISKKEQPEGFAENLEVARSGGEIAGDTRKAIERRTGKPVVSTQNAAQLNGVVTELIEAIAAPEPEKPEDNQN